MSEPEQTRVTVRCPKEWVEQLDDAIMREKLDGNIERAITRSDILRYLIAGIVVDREGRPGLHKSVLTDMPEFITVDGNEVVIDREAEGEHDKED
jgi:hypothetical protein